MLHKKLYVLWCIIAMRLENGSDGPLHFLQHNKLIIIIFNDEWNIVGLQGWRCDHQKQKKNNTLWCLKTFISYNSGILKGWV